MTTELSSDIRLEILERDVKEIKDTVKLIYDTYQRETGAKKALMWFGGIILSVLALRPWEWFSRA